MHVEHITLELMVRDVSATLDFWLHQLGFTEVGREPDEAPTWAMVRRGGFRVAFKQAERLRAEFDWFDGQPQGGTAMVCIDVDDLEAWHAELARRFAVIDHPHITACGKRQFAIRDPDHYVIVFQRSLNPRA